MPSNPSQHPDSLRTGKFTGNFNKRATLLAIRRQEVVIFRGFNQKFPAQVNREIFSLNCKSASKRDAGRIDSNALNYLRKLLEQWGR
ncbi:MAG: hypothetical protein ACRECV_12195, partial [Xanthobacteraceae bacterium]